MTERDTAKIRPLRAAASERDVDLWVVGVNHRTAPVELREKLAIADSALGEINEQAVRELPIREAVILSTCNRVELVGVATRGRDDIVEGASKFLARGRGLTSSALSDHRYVHQGRDAVQHLFRVAASLDSMVVGEPQILGQLKEQYRVATEAGAASRVLRRCFEASFRVAKRVRSETGVATKSVSVSSAAVDLAKRIFEDLGDKTAMLIGAGKMSELAARHLLRAGVARVLVTNRSFDRAVELSREFDGTPVPFDRFTEYLHMADVVLGSVAVTGHVVGPSHLHDVLRARRRRPMFFIDLGVPRNFDPALNDLQNVYLYNIDDLARVADDHRAEREREARRAEEIVRSEADGVWRALSARDVTPTIVALRTRLDAIREAELERALAALPEMSSGDRRVLEAMTQAMVNKILHSPTRVLKDIARSEDGSAADTAEALHRLFDLGPQRDPEGEPEE